jgi:hypothetical protein
MKAKFFSLLLVSLFLSVSIHLFAQNSGLSVSLTKTNGNIFSTNSVGKHILNFEITGIESANQVENLLKYVRGFRGVEEFNIQPIEGANKWVASGTFYEFSDVAYFKNLFKIMKVTEIIENSQKTTIDNL